MNTKVCSCCGETKSFDSFYSDRSRKDGKYPSCKTCHGLRVKKWAESNPDAVRRKTNKHYAKSKETRLAQAKAWRLRNPEKWRNALVSWRDRNKEHMKEYASLNRGRRNATEAKRRANKISGTPPWVDLSAVDELYALAKRLSASTGVIFHVDHVVPLKSKRVCGLHTEQNLQVIPAVENLRKHNRQWPDMP